MATSQPASRRKVVLITGATGAIGKATALAFAKTGEYDLALHYNSASESTRNDLAAELETTAPAHTAGPRIQAAFFQADFSDTESFSKLYQSVVVTLGDPDILFNSAGSTQRHSNTASIEFDRSWRINVQAAIRLSRYCLPYMLRERWGRIIVKTTSVDTSNEGVVDPHFARCREGQHYFVSLLAGELRHSGITVNGIAPNLIVDSSLMDYEELEGFVAPKLPIRRLGRPDEVVPSVMFIVNNGTVNGVCVGLDVAYYLYESLLYSLKS